MNNRFPTQPLSQPLRVVFFGTPEFASTCLESIIASPHRVIGVVTAPDRKAGRGHQLQPSDVKKTSANHRIPLLQPHNLKDPNFTQELMELSADVFIVVAFRMLPEVVWDMPKFGTINLHASLLPELRGAAPIHWAIIHGLKKTGVTTFALQHAIDTGDILMQQEVAIRSDETAGSLHSALLDCGKALLVSTLNALKEGTLKPRSQHSVEGSCPGLSAPKLTKENTLINWNQTVENVMNKIHGLSPYPRAWTASPHGEIKVLKASRVEDQPEAGVSAPGDTGTTNRSLVVRCSDGWVRIDELIPPGRRPMTGREWLNGLSEPPGHWGNQW